MMDSNEIGYRIRRAAFGLHKALMPILSRSAYKRAVAHALPNASQRAASSLKISAVCSGLNVEAPLCTNLLMDGTMTTLKAVKDALTNQTLIIYLLSLLGWPLVTAAQDTYFTQTSLVPLQINPAHIATDHQATLMLDYRRQQFLEDVSVQSTVFTGKYPLIKRGTNERWGGVGFSLLNDHSDDQQLFRRTQVEAAFAYNTALAPRTYLSGGVQGGYHQQQFSASGVTTGSQYIRNRGFDPGADIGESIPDVRSGSWNLGGGLHFYRTDARQEAMTYLGVSVFRTNHPQESLLTNTYRLPRRYVVQGGQRVFDNRTWAITPNVLWMREGSRSLLRAGASYRYHFKNNNPLDPLQSGSVAFGTYYTDAKALALSLQFNQPYFSAGFSYDISTNGQAVQNTTELSLAICKTINRRQSTKVVRDYSVGDVRKFYESRATTTTNPSTPRPSANGDEAMESTANNAAPTTHGHEAVAFSLKKTFEFAFNDDALTPEAQAYFDDFVTLMQINPTLNLKVVGHTDNVGKERVNLKVSLARAQSVKDYLVAQGVAEHRVVVVGMGAAEPLVPNDTAVNRAKNRRVELIVSQ